MPKQPFQDVVPGKRSIRDVPVPTRKREPPVRDVHTYEQHSEQFSQQEQEPAVPSTKYPFDYNTDTPHGSSRKGLWILGGLFVVALIFGVVSLFSSAQVVVTTKSQVVPANLTLTASQNQPAGVFGYQVVSVSASTSAQVAAGTSAQVSTKASGTIVVYNTSATKQNLVATTRFETSAGLVYRANTAVSVPAGTTAAPGSASVQVSADQPGSSYNISLSDFTLPGLAGTAQATKVYGRSKTTMTGGFSGMQKSVDPNLLATSTLQLQAALKDQLQSQIKAQIPNTFIFYPSSLSYNFGSVSQAASSDPNQANLTLSGTATAVIFDRSLLSQAVLTALNSQLSVGPQNAPATVTNLENLTLTLIQPPTISQDYTGNISFSLAGDTHVQWLFDQTALKSDLVGLKKSNLNALLQAKYPTIDSASAKIFPVWKTSFPSDPSKITITEASQS